MGIYMPQIQITCDTPDSQIYYSINNANLDQLYSGPFNAENGNVIKAIGKKDGYDNSEISEFKVPQLINVIVGNTYTIDGIEVFCIKEGQAYTTSNNVLIDDGSVSEVTEHPIFVDKNHDLVWYIEGNDFVDQIGGPNPYYINDTYKYGYEWGNKNTNIINTNIEAGLENTNSLITLNLQPKESEWYVIWDKVTEARNKIGSNKWFVPSKDELNLIYENKNNLNNLSLNNTSTCFYWSSSEYTSNVGYYAWGQYFLSGFQYYYYKDSHSIRVRLCRQI